MGTWEDIPLSLILLPYFTTGRKRTKRAETAIAFFCHTWKLTKPLTKREERDKSEVHEEFYCEFVGATRDLL